MSKDRNSKGKIYAKWKYSVFVRDGWKCNHCNSDENLHAHHIIGWNENEDLRYEVSNGLTLCSSCHTKLHSTGRTAWNKGKKASPELRKKLSNAHLGQKAWNKGKKMSPEYVAKMSAVRMGVKRGPHSEEHKARIGAANKAVLAKNSEWRKGKTWYKCHETGKRIWIEKINLKEQVNDGF